MLPLNAWLNNVSLQGLDGRILVQNILLVLLWDVHNIVMDSFFIKDVQWGVPVIRMEIFIAQIDVMKKRKN